MELASWFSKQYESSTLGLLGSWSVLVTKLVELTSEEFQALLYHTVALPATLKPGAALIPHRFRSTSSRRATSTGCDAKTTDKLLSALLSALCGDLGIDCLPGGHLVREPSGQQGKNDKITSLILVGSSHMRRAAELLNSDGYSIKLVSLLRGLPTDTAIEKARD